MDSKTSNTSSEGPIADVSFEFQGTSCKWRWEKNRPQLLVQKNEEWVPTKASMLTCNCTSEERKLLYHSKHALLRDVKGRLPEAITSYVEKKAVRFKQINGGE